MEFSSSVKIRVTAMIVTITGVTLLFIVKSS